MHGLPAPVSILGIPIHPVSIEDLLETLIAWGANEQARLRRVFYVNVHAMNLSHRDSDFAADIRSADLVFCDGYGVKLAARLLGEDIPQRMTPPDWIDAFAAATAAAGQRVFALGEELGVADRFQKALARDHSGYAHAGSHHGFFQKKGPENDHVIAMINASAADHLLVGFGMPIQERWIVENADRLRVRTAISVGALFRWRAGFEQRAPRWMSDHGFEWLDRLRRHPVRHFRRYAIGNPLFMLRVMRQRLRGRP
jgi:N-acetylglucosaminyldiphosphoundecaprenol N-acetyl-beta-D-mannosaminyltransferase